MAKTKAKQPPIRIGSYNLTAILERWRKREDQRFAKKVGK
jgi:hypothetical protein